MTQTKQHIPSAGYASGLKGRALCGASGQYQTGDHELVRRLARDAKRSGSHTHYCQRCVKALEV
jgi:hypothetical protein